MRRTAIIPLTGRGIRRCGRTTTPDYYNAGMANDPLTSVLAAALEPARFRTVGGGRPCLHHRRGEETFWETYRGHLLDRSQTRQRRLFDAWHLHVSSAAVDPFLSLWHDAEHHEVYLTRSFPVRGWEAYEDQGIIQSRPVEKPLRELVGSLDLKEPWSVDGLRKVLDHLVFLALVGTSRLPITSLESPLPAFTLGELRLAPRECVTGTDAADLLQCVLEGSANPLYRCKFLEMALRATPPDDVGVLLKRLVACSPLADERRPILIVALRQLFNEVALSPYTSFVPTWTRFLQGLARPEFLGAETVCGLFGYMLRHLARHLAAYDLDEFHNRGANYPDALALEEWLGAFMALLTEQPGLALGPAGAIHRRAFRQALVLRKRLEGTRVPDAPTSPGENLRVLPAQFPPVPDEQLTRPERRMRQLYDQAPTEALLGGFTAEVFRLAVGELAQGAEMLELGMALFLDRPLGTYKAPGEVDRTPLFAYEAFSKTLMMARLGILNRMQLPGMDAVLASLPRLAEEVMASTLGIPATDLPGHERPGVIALEDAMRASPDFRILRSTRGSLQALERMYRPDDERGAELLRALDRSATLAIRSPRSRRGAEPAPFLTVYDERGPRLELGVAREDGRPVRYQEYAGTEFLAEGLRVQRTWSKTGQVQEFGTEAPVLRPLCVRRDREEDLDWLLSRRG